LQSSAFVFDNKQNLHHRHRLHQPSLVPFLLFLLRMRKDSYPILIAIELWMHYIMLSPTIRLWSFF
jgi:hypothetical protein